MELYANALTTIEQAIAVLNTYPFISEGINFSDPDVVDEIIRLINYWSNFVEESTNTKFGVKTYTEFYKGTLQPTLVVKHFPVKEITSFQQIGANGEVTATYDVNLLMNMMSEDDLNKGILYVEPSLFQRFTSVGIVPEPFTSLRSYKLVYSAGYTLPKDATEENPSDVPPALENLVLELVRSQFVANTDSMRANNLISLTEGNVQRMWANPTEFKLTSAQEKIISLFKRKGI